MSINRKWELYQRTHENALVIDDGEGGEEDAEEKEGNIRLQLQLDKGYGAVFFNNLLNRRMARYRMKELLQNRMAEAGGTIWEQRDKPHSDSEKELEREIAAAGRRRMPSMGHQCVQCGRRST